MSEFSDVELKTALEQALAISFGEFRSIVRMDRQPFSSRTSHFIEEVGIRLSDGLRLTILSKHVGPRGLLAEAADVKPLELLSPIREIEVYRRLLSNAKLGTARFYGSLTQPEPEGSCLFLERVHGKELFQFGDLQVWKAAARWLAALHARFREIAPELSRETGLIRCNRQFYLGWANRARAALRENAQIGALEKSSFSRICELYGAIADRLAGLPRTLIHGEFYPSNILADPDARPLRICPVDWEMAALGPGLIDLAALTAGRWNPSQRAELTDEYRRRALRLGLELPQDFEKSLDCCRCHLAMLWLGWSAGWTPPEEHRHDWLREALDLGERLLEDFSNRRARGNS